MARTEIDEIELVGTTRVIADLHLDTADETRAREFCDWLDALEGVARLAILGDLFDAWVGPAQAGVGIAPRVLQALARCAGRGIAIDVVPGNRDFLLDRSFEERTGVRLHGEGFVARVAGGRVLCVHGDTLCTKDHSYQRLRRVLRSRTLRWIAPRVPLALGSRLARRLRRESVRAVALKLPDEKSIQESAVVAAAQAFRCETLLCGHAHEYRDQRLSGGVRFVVVGAYGSAGDVIDISDQGALTVRSKG